VKLRILLPFLFLFVSSIYAQETIFEEKTTVYVEEYSGGVGMHTNGFSLNFRYGKYKGAFKKKVFEIELATINHPKEIRVVNPLEDQARGYVFGKLNSFFTLRPNIGFQKIFIPKQSLKGVSITYLFHTGLSLGFLKPVYLEVYPERSGNGRSSITTLEKYDPEKHSQELIYGKGSFLNGFDEIKIYPGFYSKFGLEFDFSGKRDRIRALEVGLTADLFMKEVPIMALTENRNFFLNLYIAILIGKKETK
jgi:hypothetical protein